MRESIGGAFLIKIMIVFIVLYNTLLAIAVNYAMVFRVKNHIIDLLEQYEGCNKVKKACENGNCISQYITSVGYYRAAAPVGQYSQYNCSGNNYCIQAIQDGNRGTHYRVTTFITFDFPVIKQLFNVTVSGETKTIYGVYEEDSDCKGV